MSDRSLSSLKYVLVVAGPLLGIGLLLFNFVVSCGPSGYPSGEMPRGVHRIILDWHRVGIGYGNGCEITYHPVVLFGGFTLIGAGIISFTIVWRDVER